MTKRINILGAPVDLRAEAVAEPPLFWGAPKKCLNFLEVNCQSIAVKAIRVDFDGCSA